MATSPKIRITTDAIVFDGSNAAHRISNASTALTNSKGERVEVVFGLLRMVSSILRQNPAKSCYIVWDGKGSKARRQAKDPLYKANRGKEFTDEDRERIADMHRQVDVFWGLFGRYLPIHWMISEKYEADDLIAMIAFEMESTKKSTLIVTGDKDMLQLVSYHTHVFRPGKDNRYTPDSFQDLTGYPDGLAFLYGKCLQGDSSDNVPGVRGIGEKTALKIMQEHGWSLAAVLGNHYDLLQKSAVGQRLMEEESKNRVSLNYTLMSLLSPVTQRGLQGDKMRHIEVKNGSSPAQSVYLKTHLAKQGFASILGNFAQFITPFSKVTL